MSTSGTYTNWTKVQHPDKVFYQMTSDTRLPSFFFGGSQVPSNLGIMTGSGIKKKFYNSTVLQKSKDVLGRGIHTTYEHTDRIMMPNSIRKK